MSMVPILSWGLVLDAVALIEGRFRYALLEYGSMPISDITIHVPQECGLTPGEVSAAAERLRVVSQENGLRLDDIIVNTRPLSIQVKIWGVPNSLMSISLPLVAVYDRKGLE